MKVTFEFNTESEGFDNTELETHIQAHKMVICISRITSQIRAWYKLDERDAIPTEEISEKIFKIINEEIDLERLGY